MMAIFRLVLAAAIVAFSAPQATAEDSPRSMPVQGERELPQRTMPGDGALGTESGTTQSIAPYSWDVSGANQHATQWALDEPRQRHMLLPVLVPALIMVLLVVVGFTIAIRCMLAESQRKRIRYRTRGPNGPYRPGQQLPYVAAREIAVATASHVESKALRVKPAPDGNQSPAFPSASV